MIVRVRFGNAGWTRVDDLGLPGPLYVRVWPEDDGRRLRIIELYLDGSRTGQPIAPADLRQLPVTQIEALINAHAEHVHKRLDLVGPNLSTLATYYDTTFMNYPVHVEQRNWAALNFADQLHDEERDQLPPFKHVEAKASRTRGIRDVDLDFRLDRGGPTGGLTDEFLQDVAHAYRAAVARGERPNVAMAEQTGYLRRSVEGWVYMARQRGIMPPGSKGRAG